MCLIPDGSRTRQQRDMNGRTWRIVVGTALAAMCSTVVAGVVGGVVLYGDVQAIKANVSSNGQRLARIEELLDARFSTFSERTVP